MFLLRRTAARALSASPSKAIFVKPRSINTRAPVAFRSRQQQWNVSVFQRRFASDEVAKTESEEAKAEAASEASSESFAQTAAEAPVEESVAPAPEAPQAESTNESATVGVDALEAAASQGTEGRGFKGHNATPNKTIYVGNLYYEVTEDQLKRVFSRFGAIDSVKVVYDNRGMSRGFAYVEYENISDAQAAVENLDMQVFEGRNLVVQFHRPKSAKKTFGEFPANPPAKTLFIGNMSFEMSDKDLNDLFRDIRNVMDVRVAIDRRTGQPRGFAHADFIDVASATRAREVLKTKVIYGRQLRVDFSKSGTQQQREPRQERTDRGGRGDRDDRSSNRPEQF
ncbi:RNA-binding domain-containing protein [Lindgomyces ingoldianus]|uniref:RNA-binding domain-containing protein n=1 Tax=Lindgomyces ingoldianus TaxID=673940 RepID=A0ACB6QKP9_9PLEO|nr:RNA-binding domain-containing protein [Lindgomyces ingoldianus]KAF2467447.1 RNA-binding domain-containing protein [Lindgomyces ingoldianus]